MIENACYNLKKPEMVIFLKLKDIQFIMTKKACKDLKSPNKWFF